MPATAQATPGWVDGLTQMVKSLTDRIDRYEQSRRSDTYDTHGAQETHTLPRQRQADPPRRNPDLAAGRINLTTSGERRAAPDAFGAELENGVVNMNTNGQRADALLRQTHAFFNKLSRTLTPEERNQIAAARSRADGAYSMHARTVPEYLPGETPTSYRKRLADGLKDFCQPLRCTNMDGLPDSALALAEDRVYQDAIEAARRPNVIPTGTLRARTYRDEATGHNITEYFGDSASWLAPFMAPGAKVKLNRNPVREPTR